MREFCTFCLLLMLLPLAGQSLPKGHHFEAGLHVGSVFKHRSTIQLPAPGSPPVMGGEFSWEHATHGRKPWQRPAGFPRMGLVLSYQNFGDSRLGWGMGLMPQMTFKIFKYKKLEMFSRLAFGFSYVSQHWDGFSNPLNNIIGSHINNNTGFRFGFAYEMSKKLELRPSFSFTHYSNAASQFPNLGINVLSFHLGLLFKDHPLEPEDYIIPRPGDGRKRIRRPQFHVSSALGPREIGRTFRGPKYPVWVNSVDVGLFLTPINRIKAGFTHEYQPAQRAFLAHSSGQDEAMVKSEAHRYLFFVEDEILYGHFSVTGQIGYYFKGAPVNFPFTRIGMRYYPLDPIHYRVSPYLGIRMKSHMIIAEYFDVVLGVTLN